MAERQDQPPVEPLRIGREEAHREYRQGTAAFVGLRSPEEYQFAHIANSINIPLRELSRHAGELPRDRLIVTGCT